MSLQFVGVISLVSGLVMICPVPGAGQQTCPELVQSIPVLEARQLDHDWIHLYWEALRVAERVAAEGMADRREATDLTVKLQADTDSLWTSSRADSTRSRYLAEILANIISAENLKLGDASGVVASSMYARWRLQPEPALRVLADPLQRPRARTLAVRAVRDASMTSGFMEASLAALCSLAANAVATSSIRPNGERLVSRVLNTDDLTLYMEIQAALAQRSDVPKTIQRIEALLPDHNPVREAIVQFLRKLQ